MRRTLIPLLLVVVFVAAGCGGGNKSSSGSTSATTAKTATAAVKPSGPPLTKAQYEAKLRSIAAEVAKSFGSTSTSKTLTKADIGRFVTAMHELASRFAAVKPPAEIKTIHAKLIQALNDFADEFPQIADQLNKAAAKKDASGAIAALFGAHAVQELNQVQTDLKNKGYTLNLNS